MRKIVLGFAVSLDGFIEGPDGEYDWCFTDQDYGLVDFSKQVDTAFMGRKTYERILTMDGTNAVGFPHLKEYVFSSKLDKVKDGATLIRGDIKKEVLKIKEEKGKDIWLFGGAGLTTSLLNLGLVDEFFLAVHPILLGRGKRLFNDIQNKIILDLIETKTFSTGLISLKYSVKHK